MCALPTTRDRTFPLARRHAVFKLTRLQDGKSLAPVAINSPYEFLVEGSPDLRLMRERCQSCYQGSIAFVRRLGLCSEPSQAKQTQAEVEINFVFMMSSLFSLNSACK